ncbi:hypothetical protein NI17_014200 [Thermobifida halotolerans]|uniref:Uncharacterized protein n=1 Tax=Thermobifida halotolerans TaxID=483545 RepID=A0A399G418_9ACTN|nr:hypothetical protein [Thermobifida halotolerans]UOE18006.1 hypothetical protein NI17_014200 [Thermobifida halotolerans]
MPSRSLLLVAALVLTATSCVSTDGGATPDSAAQAASDSHTPDPRADAQRVAERCPGCADEVQVITGLVHEGEPARLVLTEAEMAANSLTGADRMAAVFLVRNSDDRVLADNLDLAATGFVPLPDGDPDTTTAFDRGNGNFVLLTQDQGQPERQLLAWLNQDDLATVRTFTQRGVATTGQSGIETVDTDRDGSHELVSYLGDETPEWADRDVRFLHRFHPESLDYLPWRCAESDDGGVSYPDPVTMYEAPCYEFGNGPLPWHEGE